MNNARMGVSIPSQLGIFAYFRVLRVKLSCREGHQKRFFHQMESRVAMGGAVGGGVILEGSLKGGH